MTNLAFTFSEFIAFCQPHDFQSLAFYIRPIEKTRGGVTLVTTFRKWKK